MGKLILKNENIEIMKKRCVVRTTVICTVIITQ